MLCFVGPSSQFCHVQSRFLLPALPCFLLSSVFSLACHFDCNTNTLSLFHSLPLHSFRYLFVRYASTSVLSYGSSHGDVFFHQPLPRYCNSTPRSACGDEMPVPTAGFTEEPDSNRNYHVTLRTQNGLSTPRIAG